MQIQVIQTMFQSPIVLLQSGHVSISKGANNAYGFQSPIVLLQSGHFTPIFTNCSITFQSPIVLLQSGHMSPSVVVKMKKSFNPLSYYYSRVMMKMEIPPSLRIKKVSIPYRITTVGS